MTKDPVQCHRILSLLKFPRKRLKRDCVFFKNTHSCGCESKSVCTRYQGEEKELINCLSSVGKRKNNGLSIQQERFGQGTKKTRAVRTVENCDTLL